MINTKQKINNNIYDKKYQFLLKKNIWLSFFIFLIISFSILCLLFYYIFFYKIFYDFESPDSNRCIIDKNGRFTNKKICEQSIFIKYRYQKKNSTLTNDIKKCILTESLIGDNLLKNCEMK